MILTTPPCSSSSFHYWHNPSPADLGANLTAFLRLLPGPTHIHLSGSDPRRHRVIATLLHGNEPSGLEAIFNTLKQRITPVVDIHYFILSVDAAKQAPGFIYRMLPHQKDLNRCFGAPAGDDAQSMLARELLACIEQIQPECLFDIHNTSGSSPPFGVTTRMDPRHNALVSLFTHRMIVTDLMLGALMEISSPLLPAVTIECGGALDSESGRLATEGLSRVLTHDDILTDTHEDILLEYFHNPMRLELQEGSDIAYGERCLFENGVTLLPMIENHNFGFVDSTCQLGFVSGTLEANLRAVGSSGENRVSEFFQLIDGKLFPARELKLFMVTTNPEIARKDCLCYLVEGS